MKTVMNLLSQSTKTTPIRIRMLAPLLVATCFCGLPAAANGQANYQRLISFDSAKVPCSSPNSLVEGSDGQLYGTTYGGGAGSRGTVFKLSKNGSGFRVLRSFVDSGGDGCSPQAALVEGSDGTLYGTASQGGTGGGGTVFKLNKDGSGYRTLRSFNRNGNDGSDPLAGMIEGSDGALYGTTYIGGTVFKLNKDGKGFTVLHSFGSGRGDGSGPFAGLAQGSDGTLYGTTSAGGKDNGGTVFRLNKDGTSYKVLHSFNPTDGEGREPHAALVEGSDGMLYGTTSKGDTNVGAMFKLGKDGSGFIVLHRFHSPSDFNGNDGIMPLGNLVVGNDGTLYGTTSAGGGGGSLGTLFKLSPDGSGYSVLHRFANYLEGSGPEGPALVRASDGALYGATIGGGDKDVGIIFKLSGSAATPPHSQAK